MTKTRYISLLIACAFFGIATSCTTTLTTTISVKVPNDGEVCGGSDEGHIIGGCTLCSGEQCKNQDLYNCCSNSNC